MIKRLPITIILLFVLSSTVLAQNKKEKIESMRVAFIAKEVNLSPQEAQLFWPIYNEWQDKLEALKGKRKEFKKIKEEPNLFTDKEIESYLNTELYIKQKEVELFKEYHEKLKKILTLKKVALVYKAEEEFKKELIKQLKEGK